MAEFEDALFRTSVALRNGTWVDETDGGEEKRIFVYDLCKVRKGSSTGTRHLHALNFIQFVSDGTVDILSALTSSYFQCERTPSLLDYFFNED